MRFFFGDAPEGRNLDVGDVSDPDAEGRRHVSEALGVEQIEELLGEHDAIQSGLTT